MKQEKARLSGGRIFIRYSEPFKLHVVSEIETGQLTIESARRRYGISGHATIQQWLRRYGKNHLLGKVVRVERPEEKDRVKKLEAKVRELESALAQSQVKLFAYESLVEVAEEHYKVDFKKKIWCQAVCQCLKQGKVKGVKVSQAALCKVFGRSRQGLRNHLLLLKERDQQEKEALSIVHEIRARQPRVGCRKMIQEVNRRLLHYGLNPIGRDRMFDLLRENQLLVKPLRRRSYTTNSYHRFRTYRNLLKTVVPSGPNQVWAADITYLRLRKGFSYLFLLTDVYSRKIVGYTLSRSLAVKGALKALRMARRQSNLSENIIHHSDRGIQYCCDAYVTELRENKMRISMTEINHCYENALAERVNGTLKNELLLGEVFLSHVQAVRATRQAIEIYNHERWHESLNYDFPTVRHAA